MILTVDVPLLIECLCAALQLSFHTSTFWAELAMGTTTLLECFACSRRIRWLPRPLRLMRPFQPIRCYPETAPPHWQCTYVDGQAGQMLLGIISCSKALDYDHFYLLNIYLSFHSLSFTLLKGLGGILIYFIDIMIFELIYYDMTEMLSSPGFEGFITIK